MSLSTWERQALDSIKDGLAGSDPELATLLTTFTRLAADEEMPKRATLQARSRRAIQRAPPRGAGRAGVPAAALAARGAGVAPGDHGHDRHRAGPEPG